MTKNFIQAINQIAEEKNIDKKVIIETIEAALAAAYRKDYGTPEQNIKVNFDEKTGKIKVFDEKTVVKEIDEEMEKRAREFMLLKDAKKKKKGIKEGDVVREEITPKDGGKYGRIAAQTAKQVIIQRIREAEREAIFEEYKDKEGDALNVNVQRLEGNTVLMNLGNAIGIMYPQDQIRSENYSIGQRYKVYVSEVKSGPKGPEILVSRTAPGLVEKLFELEVPEIYSKTVTIKGIAREAGSRSKMAVTAEQEGIDPVGSCVGQRGTRVQTVKAELGGENVDIIEWSDDSAKFISNSLSPAKILNVKLDKEKKESSVEVDEDQLSLAIGKEGQNVRLAAKLTGWKIDIVKSGGEKETAPDSKKEKKENGEKDEKPKKDKEKKSDSESKDKEKLSDKKAEKSTEDKKKNKESEGKKGEKAEDKRVEKKDKKSEEDSRNGEKDNKPKKQKKKSVKKKNRGNFLK